MKELFDYIAKNCDEKYLLSKTCEELTELQEVLLKMMNKIGLNKPTKESMIEEMGDVFIRLEMLQTRFRISNNDINNRKKYKANKFFSYIKQNKFRKNI